MVDLNLAGISHLIVKVVTSESPVVYSLLLQLLLHLLHLLQLHLLHKPLLNVRVLKDRCRHLNLVYILVCFAREAHLLLTFARNLALSDSLIESSLLGLIGWNNNTL